MALDTIVQAVDTSDAGRVDDVVRAVSDVAAPADVSVVLLHVFSRNEFPRIWCTSAVDDAPPGKALIGSVAQSVLLNAPWPVTFVRTD